MNMLKGVVSGITTSGNISLVEINVGNDVFSALVLETPQSAPYLREQHEVTLLFKETEVAIGKELNGNISIRNIFSCRISGMNVGEILSEIQLEYHGVVLRSIITTKSAKRLALTVGDEVMGLVKSNEIMLKPS